MKTKKIRITYNAPWTLTFCLICALILVLDSTVLSGKNIMQTIFCVPGSPKSSMPFNLKSPFDYARIFLHIFGHENWSHFLGNFSFILLLGPLLEERYGTPSIILMSAVTALVTGVLNACFIPSPLMGSSGIAFMMILLSSFTTIQKNEIPISFILIFLLYIGKEFINGASGIANAQNISTFAHIAGGICGSMFGFLVAPKERRNTQNVRATKNAQLGNTKPTRSRFSKTSDEDETVIGSIEI